jgi:hypothetical protein
VDVCEIVGMTEQIVIGSRFNGPPESGNGGYTAGLIARALAAERTGAVVTLRTPPPLDTPMRIDPAGHGIAVHAGAELVAEATADGPDGEPVPAVPYGDAVRAATGYPGFADHPFPTCYVCGPRRTTGDGLRIFPGPLPGGRTAAPWTVPADVSTVTLWAALDCPGGWAIIAPGRPYVLGRMAARVHAVPPGGARCVVTGVVAGVEGRKATVRSALYAEDGTLLALARSTWISI